MPKLDWIGKDAVVRHHLDMPYRLLHCSGRLSAGDSDSGNLLVQGDNLEALRTLLPYYAGKVKCIYIDPPYNTGKEGWKYNDKVNSPKIKKWLEKVVGEDDLCRHDKWLCMMYPRLRLLREFLREDGVVFVSIDDNEHHHLRMLMDEIFGNNNFVANITVENDTRARQYDIIATTHEYIACYTKNNTIFSGNILENKDKKFQYKDKEGDFDLYELRNRNTSFNINNRPNLYYPFYVNPKNNDNGLFEISLTKKSGWVEVYPQESQGIKTVWRWQAQTAMRHLNTVLFARKSKHGFQVVKKYRGINYTLNSVWTDKEVKTDKGTLEIKQIFGSKVFDYPKPVYLLSQLFELAVKDEEIVLDSFAGSGTTAHAVMQLNKEDDGNRKFILVEIEKEISENITAKRIQKVIKGYGTGDKKVMGLGGGFRFCTLGSPLFDEYGNVNGEVKFSDLAAHVFFSETGMPIPKRATTLLLGEYQGDAIYLLYNGIMGDKSKDGGKVLKKKNFSPTPPPPPPKK